MFSNLFFNILFSHWVVIMDLSKPIPVNLRVESASRHLYIRGLSHIQNGPEKRHFIYNPKLIFGVFFTFLIKNIVLITTKDDVNRRLVTVLADFGYYLKIQLILNVTCMIGNMLGMATMIIYWLNYKRGIAPTFLRVFDMISGEISPEDIGLTSEAQVVSLVRRADVMFKAIPVFTDRILLISVFPIYCVPGFQNSSIVEFIVYVLPNCILLELFCHYFYNFLFYHMSYLYIMCSYLKMKIESVDEEIKQSIKQRRRSLLFVIKRLYDIFEEINEYNTTYWSKFLFAFWLSIGTIAVGALSIVVKGSMETTMTIIWSFFAFCLTSIFLSVILITASINSAINQLYCKYNSLFIDYSNESKAKQNSRVNIRTMIKVSEK